MTQYLLSIYQPSDSAPPDNLDEIMSELGKLNAEMQAAGAWVFAAGLHAPSTATVLRAKGSEVLMTDGPFAEGKEHIGGFTVIEAADLDEALDWGGRMATVIGLPIEVRPIQDR
ncbi:YciI family protein [Nocardia sp. CDC153]|uniref:YciI family protein n=1 Tax=Nocardia sp. CDC153 TaxID=3112167 RepID=UPI002DBEB845|nr:YciI family protein [Nocardia sp. CDC153]MEC3954097.1 YciI family protein [Nocardia sp. CDC153]